MKYYTTIIKNEIDLYVLTRKDLQDILSEKSMLLNKYIYSQIQFI